ncbi:hypothetical protein UlMin_031960 [Ulmus minor]
MLYLTLAHLGKKKKTLFHSKLPTKRSNLDCTRSSPSCPLTQLNSSRHFESFLNNIQEKSILKKFIELEEFSLLDQMIKEYPETHLQKFNIGIYNKTIQLIKMHNEDRIHTILHFSTNIISFGILSGSSILELLIFNYLLQEFLYNLSDNKSFFYSFIN